MTAINAEDLRSAELLASGPGPRLTANARVCALVPHFNADPYLADALESLLEQTRPLDAIIVIDDASPEPPVGLIEQFPSVTLLRSEENVGPYSLIQRAIEMTEFDAYLFQDADDWSAPERLELLLDEAIRTGAELIGSQGLRVIVDEGEIVTYLHSLSPNTQLRDIPTSNPIHHPTSLVSRALVTRLGGFPTGLRFSGDTEFQRRAGYVARLDNSANFLYFYRTHPESLTGSDETGHHTEARREVIEQLHDRATENMSRYLAGLPPRLEPMTESAPAKLVHLAGPDLGQLASEDRPERNQALRFKSPAMTRDDSGAGASTNPVAIIGAPRSGVSLLAGCLAQHHAFQLLMDPDWLASVSHATHELFRESAQNRLVSDLALLGVDEEALARHLGGAIQHLLLDGQANDLGTSEFDALFEEHLPKARSTVIHRRRMVLADPSLTFEAFALYRLYPDISFIHMVRDPLAVADSLTSDNQLLYRSHFERRRRNEALDLWKDYVDAAAEIERAFGAERVLRVERDSFVSKPEDELDRIMSFLGERTSLAMLRPLR